MEELFFSSGKIYVVIGVVTIILVGLFGYLIYIDRKISRIEKKLTLKQMQKPSLQDTKDNSSK